MVNFKKRFISLLLSFIVLISQGTYINAYENLYFEKKEVERGMDEETFKSRYPLSYEYLNKEIVYNQGKKRQTYIIQFEDGKKNECIEKLKKLPNIEIKYNYDSVFEGVSVVYDSDKISDIRDINGVKNIQENGVFAPQMSNAKQMTRIKEAVDYAKKLNPDKKFDGRGTVVAIIDSGIDINHESMKLDDDVTRDEMKIKTPDPGFTDKVPHGFSYVGGGANLKDNVIAGHGMHCAGIIAGNSDKLKGVVPNAQIFMYRMFSDASYYDENTKQELSALYEFGGDDAVYHAIDDAVKNGADVISMSIGQLGNGYVGDLYYETIKRAAKKGTIIVCAIGNYASASGENTWDLNPINNLGLTNTSAMTYYAGIEKSLSVGAVSNNNMYTKTFSINGKKYPYYIFGSEEENEKVIKKLNLKEQIDIVYLGHGRQSAYKDADVKGKIVLVERDGARVDGSKIVDKIQIAKEHGAIGFIMKNSPLYTTRWDYLENFVTGYENNEDMTEKISGKIFAINIRGKDGEELKKLIYDKNSKKTFKTNITFNEEYEITPVTEGLQVTGFTGWGPNAQLDLKPEVVAPGENIFSAMNGNRYGLMSGTSMATPHVAGISAMLLGKVKKIKNNKYFEDLDNADINKILLMNTTDVVKDVIEKDLEVSPRRQGSGMVRADKAIKNEVLITENTSKKGVAQLRDFKEDLKQITFRLDNFSNQDKTYDIRFSKVLGETVEIKTLKDPRASKIINGDFTDTFSTEDVKVSVPKAYENGNIYSDINQIIVPKNSNTNITVTLDTRNIQNSFVEGFIYFDSKNQNEYPSLSIPYFGFKGDWQTGVKILDKPMWEDDSIYKHTCVVGLYPNDGHGEEIEYKILGVDQEDFIKKGLDRYGATIYDEKNIKAGAKVDPEKIAFSVGFFAPKIKTVTLRMVALQEIKNLEVAICDANKKPIRVLSNSRNYRKQVNSTKDESEWQTKVFYRPNLLFTWDGKVYNPKTGEMQYAKEGQYYYRVRAKVKETDEFEEMMLPVKLDNKEAISDYSTSGYGYNPSNNTFKLKIQDDNMIKFVGASIDNKKLNVHSIGNDEYLIEDVKINELTKSKLHIEAMDYAENLMEPININLNESYLNIKNIDNNVIEATIKNENIKDIKAYQGEKEVEIKKDGVNIIINLLNDKENLRIVASDNESVVGEENIVLNKPSIESQGQGKDARSPKEFASVDSNTSNEFARSLDYGMLNYYLASRISPFIEIDDTDSDSAIFNPGSDWPMDFKDSSFETKDYKVEIKIYNTRVNGFEPIYEKTFKMDRLPDEPNFPVKQGTNIISLTFIDNKTKKIVYSRGVLVMLDTIAPKFVLIGDNIDEDEEIIYANDDIINLNGTVKENLDEVIFDINGDNVVTIQKAGEFGQQADFSKMINVQDGDKVLFKAKDRWNNHMQDKIYTIVMDKNYPSIELLGVTTESTLKVIDIDADDTINPIIQDDRSIKEKTIVINGNPYIEGEKIGDYVFFKQANIQIVAKDIAGNVSHLEVTANIKNKDDNQEPKLLKTHFLAEDLSIQNMFGVLPEGLTADIKEKIDASEVGEKEISIIFTKNSKKNEIKYNITIIPTLKLKLKTTKLYTDDVADINNLVEKDENFDYSYKISPTKNTGNQKVIILISDKYGNQKEEVVNINVVEKEKTPKPKEQSPFSSGGSGSSSRQKYKKEKTVPNKLDLKIKNEQDTPKINKDVDNYKDYEYIEKIKDIKNHWAKDIIKRALVDNLVMGYPDSKFRPNNKTTRSEFIAISNRLFKLNDDSKLVFKDVKESDWFAKDLKAFYKNDLVKGDKFNNFNPQSNIKRQEIISILIRYIEKQRPELLNKDMKKLTFKDTKAISPWALESIQKAYSLSIINGDDSNMLNPKEDATRAEVVQMIYNLKNLLDK